MVIKNNFISKLVAGNWHKIKIKIFPDTPRTLRDESFYKPISDDIVDRLRYECKEWCGSGFGFVCNKCDAVSEIERLRKELTTEQTLVMLGQVEINHLQEWKQVANMFGECFRMDEFGQSPVSDGQDVFQATLAWERLRTKEARRD